MSKLYAGLDVSDRTTSVCIVDEAGEILLEAAAATTPDGIAAVLAPHRRKLKLVGQEAGTKAAWLHRELVDMRYPMRCLETRAANAFLNVRLNKTDRNDARGLALLLASGRFSEAYVKSAEAIRIRAVLMLRDAVIDKHIALRHSSNMARKALGTERVRKGKRRAFPPSEALGALNATFASVERSVLALAAERLELDREVKALARESDICQRLMTIPGVGPIAALTFVAEIDDPRRFKSSRAVAAYLGLTPRLYQSGTTSRSGRISRRGDPSTRKALYMAAKALMQSHTKCALQRWTLAIAEAKNYRLACIACARRLAVLMHHLWITGQDFDPGHVPLVRPA